MKEHIGEKSLLAFVLLLGAVGAAGCSTRNGGLGCAGGHCPPVDALGSADKDATPDLGSTTKADALANDTAVGSASDVPALGGSGGAGGAGDGGAGGGGIGAGGGGSGSGGAGGSSGSGAGGSSGSGAGGASGGGSGTRPDAGSFRDAQLSSGPRMLDLIFMIDNSPSMAPKQEKLKAQFPKLISALRDPTTNALPDLRVAILDSDLGSGGAYLSGSCGPNTGNGDSNYGDQGKFRMIGATTCGVTDPNALWLEYKNDAPVNFTGDIDTVFACLADGVGTVGCGLEHQIQAVEYALTSKGIGNQAQQAMLRPEAYLGLVFLTDEDDCSAATNDGLFGDRPELAGEAASLRCGTRAHACSGMNLTDPPPAPGFPTTTSFQAPFSSCMARTDACPNAIDGDQGTDTSVPTSCSPLRDFKRVANEIKQLKTDPSRQILVAGIFGWPVGGDMTSAELYKVAPVPNPNSLDTAHPTVFDYWPVCYDPDHLPVNPDPTTGFDVAAAGWGATGGVRMSAFIDEFGPNGIKLSICERDFGTVMKEIGDRVAGTLSGSGGAGGTRGSGGATGAGGAGGRVSDAGPAAGGTGGRAIDGGVPATGGSGGSSGGVDCGPLSNPANGLVYAPYTSAGATASYSCVAGYTLSGSSLRICQATGVWTGTAPTCVSTSAGTCPALAAPAGGTVSATARTTGSVATYACGTGYTMAGAATRTCQSDGTWSGTAPTCAGVDCGAPPAPAGGSVSAPTTTYPSTATFSCPAGFTLSGTGTITCQADGTWSGKVPACVCNKTNCNGACIDTQTDANNCGGCGSICPVTPPSTVACVSGRCLTTLASTDQSLGLAVNATDVYWSTATGKIMTVPLAGGSATTLATGQNQAEDIAVGTDGAYWVSYFGGTVMKIPLPGGEATTIASGQGSPSGVVVDATSVYWSTGSSVMKASHNGATATPLTAGSVVHPWKLALDATNVYWVDGSAVVTVSLNGGACSTLSSGLPGARDVAIDGTNAYAANIGTSANNYIDGTVTKVPLGGGTTTILAQAQTSPYSIAADGTSVYWANSAAVSAGGAIMRVSVDGTNLTTLVATRFYPNIIAVDSTSVYWIDGGKDGSGYVLMKLTPK